MITRATLGFLFSEDLKKVLLISKTRPSWQVGKLNAIGGKCEAEESFLDCVVREVGEETGLKIPASSLTLVGSLNAPEWQIEIFAGRLDGEQVAKSLTEEQVAWYDVKKLPLNCMSNLPWLIPLCVDVLTNDIPPTVEIVYR